MPKKPTNDEVAITCAVCNKTLLLKASEAPTNASEMLSYCRRHSIPCIINWDQGGQIITFCCGDHLQKALNPDGSLKNPIPRVK